MNKDYGIKNKISQYLLVFIIGGIGGFVIPRWVLPYFGIAPTSPVTITRREEVYINEGINTSNIANSVKNALVTIYVHDGAFNSPKFKLSAALSGLIVSGDGIIVVPADGLRPEQEVTVIFSDGSANTAQIAASDAYTGLIFLKISKNDLPVINQVFAKNIAAGEKLISIRKRESASETAVFPFTAIERGIASPSLSQVYDFSKPPAFLNLSPAVASNQLGAVILNKDAAIAGFATKIGKDIAVIRTEDLQLAVNNFLDDGKIIWPIPKFSYINISESQAGLLNLPKRIGVLIKSGQAPLAEGDFVTAIDGKELNFAENAQDQIFAKNPGDKVKLKIFRQGKEIEVEIGL